MYCLVVVDIDKEAVKFGSRFQDNIQSCMKNSKSTS